MKRRATDHISRQRLLWMAVVVIGASLPHWSALPIWAPALLIACAAWRIGASGLGLPLPNRPVRLIFALGAFVAIVLQYRTLNGLHAGSGLLVVMIAMKFLEAHNQRDQLVMIMISYFLVFAGLLYQDTFLSGAYLIAFVWLTTIGLLQLGRRGDLMLGVPTARLAGRLLLQSVPIMVVLFLLFPRLPGPLWAIPGQQTAATSGLSETMSPGDITDLGLSDEVAFRVEFSSAVPRADLLYWRGPVLSTFNGRSWSRRPGIWQQALRSIEHLGPPVEYRVMLEPQRVAGAFALDMPSSWSTSRRQNLQMQSDYQLRASPFRTLDQRISYEVVSHTDYRARETLSPPSRAHYSALPEDFNPRTRALIDQWRTGGFEGRALVERALDFFRAGEYFYTLTPPPLGQHSIDDFIFQTKEGFCEHYASAFAFMMRAADIPARVVTGYQGGELNSVGSYYIVRQSDAHAWTELWFEDSGWTRVDPIAAVAPERIALGSSSATLNRARVAGVSLTRIGWIRQITYAWDAVNTYWTEWILGYDLGQQRSLLERFGIDRPRWGQLLAIAIGGTVLVLSGLAAYLGWRSHRRRRADPPAKLFATFGKRLARAHVPPRAPSESAAAYAARASQLLPDHQLQIASIVGTYLRARYELDERGASLARLERLIKSFRPSRRTA